MPRVTVIIPAYNAAPYLGQAIQSVLDQTHADLEIIIVDDGSTDNTHAIAQDYARQHPNRIRVISQTNQGVALARNAGIDAASGDFFQFLDADDQLLPRKIEACLAVFADDPKAGLVYTGYEVRDEHLQQPVHEPTFGRQEGQVLRPLIHLTSTLFKLPCPLVRAEIVHRVGGFRDGMQGVEDWNFWVRIAATGAIFRVIPDKLVLYRTTPGSLSKRYIAQAQSRLAAMQQLRDEALPADIDLDKLIADRHHVLAIRYWEMGNRRSARDEFRAAIGLHPQGRRARRVLLALSYVFPFSVAERVTGVLSKKSLSAKSNKPLPTPPRYRGGN